MKAVVRVRGPYAFDLMIVLATSTSVSVLPRKSESAHEAAMRNTQAAPEGGMHCASPIAPALELGIVEAAERRVGWSGLGGVGRCRPQQRRRLV